MALRILSAENRTLNFSDKRHAAIAAAWPVASDPAKQNASAAPMYPYYLEEIHRSVTGLVSRVDALTSEVGSVKQFESQVSDVMNDLKALTSAMGKLENLEKLPEISKSLQHIVGVLSSKLVNIEEANSPASSTKSAGGTDYVA